jgi:hypothetical protein
MLNRTSFFFFTILILLSLHRFWENKEGEFIFHYFVSKVKSPAILLVILAQKNAHVVYLTYYLLSTVCLIDNVTVLS